MLQPTVAGFIGKQPEDGFIGFFAVEKIFLLLSIPEGVTQEEGQQKLEALKQKLMESNPTTLSSFEDLLSNQIISLNLPAHFSLSAGLLVEDILYIKTVGDGQVYFRRGTEFDLLMKGNNTASGYLKENDLAIFTTKKIEESIGNRHDIQAFISSSDAQTIVQKFEYEDYRSEDLFGAVAVGFAKENQIEDSAHVTETPSKLSGNLANVRSKANVILRSKRTALLIAVILLGVLIWSVVFGYQRRQMSMRREMVNQAEQKIEELLTKAEEDAFFNLDESLSRLKEAQAILNELQKDLGENNQEDVNALAKKIQSAEEKVMNKEDKSYEEFYDLALEEKEAKGDTLYYSDGEAAILDSDQGKIFVLNIENKSIDQYINSDLENATHVGMSSDSVYFLVPSKGVFRFANQTNANTIIEAEDSWGKIVDLDFFATNIYLLDSVAGDVYKYVPIETGYSGSSSYFTSPQVLTSPNSMSIDTSIFVTDKDTIFKFTRGERDAFEGKFPTGDVSISGVYASQDTEKVYVWDTSNATVYEFSDNGAYERQIQSSIIKQAKSIFSSGSNLFVFDGKKLYTITLN